MTLLQNVSVITFGNSTPFAAISGTAPYVYSVVAGGAGGTINASTGVYTAPNTRSDEEDALKTVDTIKVVDALSAEAFAEISVLLPIEIFMNIIRIEMDLDEDQMLLYNQKFKVPKDSRLYIAVSDLVGKPFGSSNRQEIVDGNLAEVQSINYNATLSVDIYSRSTVALTRKEEVIMALDSVYAQNVMSANSIKIANLPSAFVPISQEDGMAIPYRFNISVGLQYMSKKVKVIEYYSNFEEPEILTDQ